MSSLGLLLWWDGLTASASFNQVFFFSLSVCNSCYRIPCLMLSLKHTHLNMLHVSNLPYAVSVLSYHFPCVLLYSDQLKDISVWHPSLKWHHYLVYTTRNHHVICSRLMNSDFFWIAVGQKILAWMQLITLKGKLQCLVVWSYQLLWCTWTVVHILCSNFHFM